MINLILQQRRDKLSQERGSPTKEHVEEEEEEDDDDDDDEDDDIPLSKCILDQPSNLKWPKKPHHQYSILEDETLHEDDDEDLLPIGVLQDPKAKLLHSCQSAAEKYKNSILCRDPQLKVSASQRQQQQRHDQGGSTYRDRSRRSSFDPASIHHLDPLSSSSKPIVMRSFSANQQKRRQGRPTEEEDDDDDVPLFRACLAIPSDPSNAKVPR
ncbi:hypothetical protein [Absidia glauca]|uniref:Uncharacterized protein n=1 Tax=Absidia glauca TaxID=4829 RepID=A0A168MCT3_ABSGL|nr:hypothetical protein [Absidia glauca]